MAYVSKGPVLDWGYEVLSESMVDLLKRVGTQGRFTAIIVQPPDNSQRELVDILQPQGCLEASFLGIIDSTLLIDLDGGADEVTSRLRGSTRDKYNKAARCGLELREGDESDLPRFFSLMEATCAR